VTSRLDFIVPTRMALRVGFASYGTWEFFRGMAHAHPGMGSHGKGLTVTLLVAGGIGFLLLGLYLTRRDSRYTASALVVAIASSFVLDLVTSRSPAIAIACVGLFLATTRLPDVPAVVLASVTVCAGVILGASANGSNVDMTTIIAFAATLLGAIAARQAKTVRNVEERNAVLAERSRIAREIHDILAHSLSAQIVHLEGARLLLINGKSEDALDRIERAQGMARSGLEETRRALATLRGEVPPVAEVLDSLAEEFHAGTGELCTIRVSGAPRELSPEAGLAVIRTAQEALTNVRKHAPGADARVMLRYLKDWTELEVRDSGAGSAGGSLAGTGGGYGLVGMRERAALIDGTLEAGFVDDGFRVLLRVPA
jgi:signal transduction histidine kinase